MNSETAAAQKTRIALYTPFQVRLASFLGGPFSAIYTLYSNFKRLEKKREAQLTLYLGCVFVIALLVVIPFLPERFPNMAIPLAYSLAAGAIAATRQLSKEAIASSANYVRRSASNVAIVCVISLISFCALFLACLLALDCLEIIHLDWSL